MHLDLNNPHSIVTWWQVFPERHGPQLSALARLQPQFAASIREARRLIDDDPQLAARHAAARLQQGRQPGWVPSAEDLALDGQDCHDCHEGLGGLGGLDAASAAMDSRVDESADTAGPPGRWH